MNINKNFLIFISFICILFSSNYFDILSASETSDMKRKEDLKKNLLLQVNEVYSEKTKKVDVSNVKNSSQILSNDLTFEKLSIPGGTDKLRIEFKDKDIASKFKGQYVDIFGENYYYKCVGEAGENSSCMYGGVTLHKENEIKQNYSIGMNIFINGVQQETKTIQTNKYIVTVQEADMKARTIVNNINGIYDINKHDINSGIIKFHHNDEKEKSFYYDLYSFEGENRFEFLKMYNDNKTIIAKDYHIDIYLYK